MQALLTFTLAAGIAQGLFLAAMLLHLEPGNRRGARILAGLVLCLTLMIGEELLDVAGLTRRFPHVAGSTVTLDLGVAPLLLFYGWCLTSPERRFNRRDLLHFVPFVAATTLLVPFYVSSPVEKLAMLSAGLPAGFALVIGAKVVAAAAYLAALIRHLTRFLRQAPGGPEAPRTRPAVRWFRIAMIGLAATLAGALVSGLLLSRGVPVPVDPDGIGAVAICGSMFLITGLLLKHPPATWTVVPTAARGRYETSPLTPELKRHHHARLVEYMTLSRPYLDMQLTLEKLAAGLGIRPSHLSQVLNEEMGRGFHEFVNRYRVEEAKARIASGRGGSTLLSAAHEAGFNSKASFNRAFKRHTGMTPTEFARGHRCPRFN